MSQTLPEIDVLFVAGFGPISRDTESSAAFYVQTLGLPLKPMEGNSDYLLTEEGQLEGVKHFAVWPLSQAATCAPTLVALSTRLAFGSRSDSQRAALRPWNFSSQPITR